MTIHDKPDAARAKKVTGEENPAPVLGQICERPWGKYQTVDLGSRFQVKRITVSPGAQLSLQSHVHRSEHWCVVSGTAQVTVGEEEFLLGENENTYIPVGAVHRLCNPGKVDVVMIEVQTGSYFGEDDIIRYSDIYDRV